MRIATKGDKATFVLLPHEYNVVFIQSIKTKSEHEAVAVLAQDREQWKEIVQHRSSVSCEKQLRKKAEAKREERK